MLESCRTPTIACAAVACALLLVAVRAQGQDRSDSASVQTVRQAIFEAEDRRAPTEADLKTLLDGTRHPSEAVQRMAIRALGRLERPALVGQIEPALSSTFAAVRAAAAEALGQAVSGAGADASGAVQAALLKHLGRERDQAVIGAICWTLGRLPYATAQAARSAEVTLLVAALPLDAPSRGSMALPLGVARGFESLLRRNARLFTPAPETVRRLKQMALERRKPRRQDEAEDLIRVRRLAMAALASSKQADEETIAAAAADPDAQVRRLALVAMAATAAGSIPESARARFVAAGLADPDYLVRYEALRIHGRTLATGAADWGPVIGALSDASPHVALLAIDLLGNPKARPESAVERLRALAGALPAPAEPRAGPAAQGSAKTIAEWHQPARALVSLARIAPDEARASLPRFAASAWWPVRMYAARAAAAARDADWLARLARDERDNVREAAVGGLMGVSGHDADGLYLEALERTDYQLVMTAARALEGTPRRTEATAGLLAALARITAEKRETSRDVRLALIARIGELGQAADALALLPVHDRLRSRALPPTRRRPLARGRARCPSPARAR